MLSHTEDYLPLLTSANQEAIRVLREKNRQKLSSNKKGFLSYRLPFESVSHLRAHSLELNADVVRIGSADDISPAEQQQVRQVLKGFMPWRKGPFEVFGIDIDAEWRSNRKWNRIAPVLPDLQDKIIADIGCNNGYYMFRMAHHQPKAVIGFEPYHHHYFTFCTLNSFAGLDTLHLELLGVEHLTLYENCFDVIFLMGIIYHRISPIEMLKDVKKSLKPGGSLIVESQAIPGDDPVALFPEQRYAKVPGTYNFAGVENPAADAMIDALLAAKSEPDFVSAVRALDRVLLSGDYVIPLFYIPKQWVSYWTRLQHPEATPLFGYSVDSWWATDKK